MIKGLTGKRYKLVKQHDATDCGAACLATVSEYYGFRLSIAKVRDISGTDRQGTSGYGLVKAAKELGFNAKGLKMSRDDFYTDFPLPAIAHVIVENRLLHYMVIYSISMKRIIVADPAKGIVRYTPEDFFKIWTGGIIALVPGEDFEKDTGAQSMLFRFLTYLKPYRKMIALIFAASLLYTGLGILSSFYIKIVFDDILKYSRILKLHEISAGIIALILIQIFMDFYRNYLLAKLSCGIDNSMILGYYRHVLELPMKFFTSRKSGEIISRFIDASKIRETISGAVLTIMIDTVMALTGGVILYMQNAFLFVISLIIVAVYSVIVMVFNKPLREVNKELMEDNASLTSYLVESLKGIETVKAHSAEGKAKGETASRFDRFLGSVFKNSLLDNLLSSLTGFVAGAGGIIIIWAGAYCVIKGKMSAGQLLAFDALLVYFLSPIRNLINLQSVIQTAIVAAERLGEILDLEPERSVTEKDKLVPDNLKGPVEFKNIDFRYGYRGLVLKNISLTVKPGEKIALVGESGSGKTTLAKLLLRFYSQEKGEILINGLDIEDINLDHIRKKISYVSQETFLFSGTIRDNICFGVDGVDTDEMIGAAKITKIHDFIEELPLKYDTLLEENGENLSGGQRQRLAITRAILKKPDMLILDEATSNLDSITEKAIEKTLLEFCKGITVIVIAHRLSTIKWCDRIFVMDKGELAESGSHDELMGLEGKYYDMWKNQIIQN